MKSFEILSDVSLNCFALSYYIILHILLLRTYIAIYVYSECQSMRRILGLKGSHVAKFVYFCVFVRAMYV